MKILKLLFLLLLLMYSSVFAAPMKITVEGTVTEYDSIFSPFVSLGDSMTASFLYDPSLINQSIQFGNERFFYYSPLIEYDIMVGGVTASGGNGRAEVTNNHVDSLDRTWDRFVLESGYTDSSIPVLEENFNANYLLSGLVLYDYLDATAFTTASPPETINLYAFDLDRSYVTIQMDLVGGELDWRPIFARITKAEINPVPISSSIWLFVCGLVGLYGFNRRRRSDS